MKNPQMPMQQHFIKDFQLHEFNFSFSRHLCGNKTDNWSVDISYIDGMTPHKPTLYGQDFWFRSATLINGTFSFVGAPHGVALPAGEEKWSSDDLPDRAQAVLNLRFGKLFRAYIKTIEKEYNAASKQFNKQVTAYRKSFKPSWWKENKEHVFCGIVLFLAYLYIVMLRQ